MLKIPDYLFIWSLQQLIDFRMMQLEQTLAVTPEQCGTELKAYLDFLDSV